MRQKRRLIHFSGTLSDFIISVYTTQKYTALNKNIPTDIVFTVYNPFIPEVLYFHPNRRKFRIYEYGFVSKKELPKFFDYLDLKYSEQSYEDSKPKFHNIVFYLSNFDKKVLNVFKNMKYVVINPSAGSLSRYISDSLLFEILSILVDRKVEIVLVGKTFKKKDAIIKQNYGYLIESNYITSLIDSEITVQGTIELIKHSILYIGSFSGLCFASLFNNIPTIVLYPERYKESFIKKIRFLSLEKNQDFKHGAFSEFQTNWILEFIDEKNINPFNN